MVQQHADQHVQRDDTGKAMKRRGILAAAGAVVAAIVAKQTAQPVTANGGTWQMPYDSGTQNTNYPLIALTSNGGGPGLTIDTSGGSAPGIAVRTSGGSGLIITTTGNGGGVDASSAGVGNPGVRSNSTGYHGVHDTTNAPAGSSYAGVYGGTGYSGNYGVHGDGSGGGIGVYGSASNGTGGSFQGGVAPLRLVPGSLSARSLTASGHKVGELYVTSDARLFFFDRNAWREILLAGQPGISPAPASRPSSQGSSPGPITPAPLPHPRP